MVASHHVIMQEKADRHTAKLLVETRGSQKQWPPIPLPAISNLAAWVQTTRTIIIQLIAHHAVLTI